MSHIPHWLSSLFKPSSTTLKKKASAEGTEMILEELDSRVLFSADPFSSLIDSPDSPPLELQAINIDLHNETDFSKDQASASNIATEIHNEIIFIDAGIEDHNKLIEDLVFTESQSRVFTVVVLDSEKDGIEQITESLQDYENLNSIHIISHGTEDRISLGNTQLSSNNINDYSTSIELWQNSLDQEADLLIYGCELAGNDAGKALTDQLSLLTGADVAASVDETGSALQGGDWTLEYSTGEIETNIAFSQQFQQTWNGLLAYQTYRDEFNSVSLANSDGTQDWSSGAWQEIGESDGEGTGNVTVSTVLGEQGLSIKGSDNGALREVDLSGATNATLSFDYARISLDDSIRVVVLEVSADGGGSWSEINRWQGSADDASLQYASFDISDYIASNTQIRFVTSGFNDPSDEFFIDNLQIAYASDLKSTSEFLVNQNTTDIQEASAESRGSQQAVSVAEDESYVVTWSSVNQDGSGWGIYARRFDASGAAMTDEVLINQTTADNQQWASVASDASGNFVVTWTSTNQDGTAKSVYARQFDMNGIALSNEFRVNDTTTGIQKNSTIAMNASGSFIISWQGSGNQPGNIDANGVFGQLFDASGTAIGSEFLVNPSSTSSEGDPAVAIDDNGKFIVVWDDAGGVQGQLYSNTGTPQGSQFNIDPDSSAGEASVAMDATGDFVVTWRETLIDRGVYAKRFDALGNAKEPTFIVNTTTSNDQTNPSVAMDSAGNFIVVWEGNGAGDSTGVFGRKFTADGSAVDGEFLINQTTSNTQHMASVTMVSLNNFIAVWSGEGAGDSSGIFARQYGTAYTINEGDSLTLNGSHLSDLTGGSLTYSWDLNNDGNYGDVVGENLTVDWSDLQGFGINDDGVYTIGLKVDDGVGEIDLKSATVTVINTAPVISTTGSTTVDQNSVYTLNLSTTDLGEDTISSWTINWGDGTIETFTGNPAAVTHTYITDSYSASNVGFTYNILASVTDEDGTHLQNDLLVTDYTTSGGFYHYSETGDFLELIGDTELDKSIGIIVGPDGNWYGTGESSNNVYRYNTDGNTSKVIATGFGDADGLAFGPDGNLYVADWANSLVYKIKHNTTDDSYTKTAITISTPINNPYGLVFGPDGHLYVNSYSDHSVHRLQYNENDPGNPNDDTFTESVYVSAGLGGLNSPEQMAFGPDGKLYLTSAGSNEILRYNPETDDMDLIATLPSGGKPEGIAFGPDGNLYISDHDNGDIIRFNLVVNDISGKLEVSGAAETFIKGTDSGLTKPVFMTFIPEQQVTVTPSANTLPALTAFSDVITTTNENTEVEITFSALQLQGDEIDAEGSINSFVVTEINSGTLMIGADAATATDWVAVSNDKIDAGNHAYWTPSLDSLGTLDAFTVVVEDQQGAISIGNITAQVNVNTAPTITSSLTLGMNENTSFAQALTANDPESDTVTFSITGGIDAALFEIDSSNELHFISAPDFESPTDSGLNNSYEVQITADDGNGGSDVQTIIITVNDTSDTFFDGSATAIWSDSASSTPQLANFNGSNFSTEGLSDNIGGPWLTMTGAEAPTRDEKIIVGVDSTGNLSGQLWDGSTWAAFTFNDIASVTDSTKLGFAVAYESQSGNAVLVWNNGSTGNTGLSYRTWNGSTWSDESVITTPLAGEPQQIKLAAAPDSNKMVLVVSNDNKQDFAMTWNGSEWEQSIVLTTTQGLSITDISVVYEQQSGDAMVIYDKGNTNLNYRLWDGTNWSNETTISSPAGVTDQSVWTTAAADPNSDRIVLGATSNNNETWLSVWDGDAWGSSILASNGETSSGFLGVAVAFESESGDALAVYTEDNNSPQYRTWNNVSGWSAQTDVVNLGNKARSLSLVAQPGTNQIMLSALDLGNDANFIHWDGRAWGENNKLETDTGQTQTQPLLFLWDQNPASPVSESTFWLSTKDDVASQGGAGLNAWTAGETLRFGHPNLELEPAAGKTSGTLMPGFNLDNFGDGNTGIDSIHYISQDLQIGASNFDLFAGDLLISTDTNETLSGLSVNKEDVFVFRPSSADDYSSGTFLMLLENPVGTNIQGITLVEQNTVIGDHTAQAGDFLIVTGNKHIILWETADVGGATTSGTQSILIDGNDSNININKNILGIDLVEKTTTVGGHSLSAGTIIITVDQGTNVGSNNTTVNKWDLFSLDVSQTTLSAGSGNGSATATLIFQGTDVGLSTGKEQLFAITTAPTDNSGPTITSSNIQSAAENQNTVVTLSASDPENDTVTFSISGGADQSKFTINSTTGQLSFINAPNFESPNGANTDNIYEVQVQADDGNGGTDRQLNSVSVNDINEAPTLVMLSATSVNENIDTSSGYVIGSLTTTDEDASDSTSYTIIGGTDEVLFSISDNDLILTDGMLDFETQASYNVTVRITDSGGLTHDQTFTINVNNLNETPIFDSTAVTVATEDTLYNYTISTNDVDGDSLSISATTKPAWLTFTDNGDGTAILSGTPENSHVGDHSVVLSVSDGSLVDTQSFTVTVTNTNDAPVINSDGGLTSAAINVAENQTAVTTVTATDVDVSDTPIFSITGGADQSLFSITSGGVLSFNSVKDFETSTDNNTDGVYEVEITANDNNSGTDVQTILVTITDVNEAPMLVTLSTATINENIDTSSGYTIGSLITSDEDAGDSVAYSINGGADAALFTISGNDLVLTDGIVDFETQSSYHVTVKITDSGGLAHDQTFTINVNNLNEAPIFDSTAVTVATEDTLYSYTISTSDVDGDSLSISATTKPVWLTITDNGDGTAMLSGTPENSHVGDHSVVLSVSDGSLVDTQSFTVTVTNTNDAPVINSDGGLTSAAINVAENQTAVTTVTATDVDVSDTPIFSITGGADQSLFSITSGGVLSFNSVKDFETSTDNDTDGIYEIEITVSDGNSGTDVQTILVTITDLNEAPTLVTLSTATINENTDTSSGYAIGSLTTSDEDAGDSTTYSISGGEDAALFSISGNELVLTDGILDFETQPSYDVTVRITDSGILTHDQTFTIDVNDLNEAPVIDSTAVTEATEDTLYSYTINTRDIDGDSVTITATTLPSWLILNDNGNGTATLTGTPDNSHVGHHSVVLFVSDGGLVDTQSFTVTVANTNDVPVINSDGGLVSAAIDVDENQTTITTVTAFDVDASDILTFSITGGADQSFFSINSDGILSFDSARDFETRTDSNTDGVYEVEVTASDGNGGTDIQLINVSVNNINEAPSLTTFSGAVATTNEDVEVKISHSDLILFANEADVDGTVDAFIVKDINSGSLKIGVSAGTATDWQAGVNDTIDAVTHAFWTPSQDANGLFNAFELISKDDLGATSKGNVIAQVNVSAVNDNPNIDNQTFSIFENILAGTSVGTAIASDVDSSDLLSFSIVDGNSTNAFTINSATGEITVNDSSLLDFENKSEFMLTVQVTDDGFSHLIDQASVNINLIDINESPDLISLSNNSVEENIDTTSGYKIGSLSSSDEDTTDNVIYKIVGGTDQLKFSIGGVNNDELILNDSTLDFENQLSYEVTVSVIDSGGLSHEKTFTIAIKDLDETQLNTSNSNETLLEEEVIIPTLQTKVEIDSSETQSQQEPKTKAEKKVVHTATESNYVLPVVNEKVNTENENQNQRLSISLVSSDANHSDSRREFKKFLNKVHAPIPVENTDFQVSSFKVDIHELQKLFRESGFTESLDFLQEQLKETTILEQAVVISSVTVSTGLSIGYVIWLIRGGVLLSSVLSSLPAWRMIDPLPIMSHLGGSLNSRDDDSESLASLINKGNEAMKLKLKLSS